MKNSLIEIKQQDKFYLLKILVNKVDASNALELKQHFLSLKEADGIKNIILNITDVKYIDSSGLSAILIAHKVATESKNIMILCGVSEHVMKLVKISQLDKILDILPLEEEAIDAVFMRELEKEFGADDEGV